MLERKKITGNACKVIGYSLPKLHKGKTWYVDFLCFDPLAEKMRRKKYHLDGIKSVRERNARAAELIATLTARLRQGWNVWAQGAESERGYRLMREVFALYAMQLDKLTRMGTIKRKTWLSWTSYLKIFREWAEGEGKRLVYAYQLDLPLVSDFLDFMLLDRDVSARTHNNYRAWLALFCGWMTEKGFIADNPVEKTKKLNEDAKQRDALSTEELGRLQRYLAEHNRHFLLACMMEYYCFIRPEELCSIRIRDIEIKAQRVRISAEAAKNRKEQWVGVNERVLRMMIDLGVFSHSGDEFLFGGRDFMPSMKMQSGRIFREEFAKVRRVLGFPSSYMFYSLKDSGIRDLANAEGIVVARDQARHSDVATTNKYLKAANFVHEETKHFEGGL